MKNNTSIGKVFSTKVFEELLTTGYSEIYSFVVDKYIDSPHNMTNREIICRIYSIMRESHRGEYFYLNTLLNKLLVGIHNVNTATALSQVHIADHIADFVLINGVGGVYEIKSDLDNLDRLNEQLIDYYKAFSYVSVLVSERKREHVEKQLRKLGKMGDSVGIYVLSARETIFSKSTSKKPVEFNDYLDSFTLFKLLRKREYENVLSDYFGWLPGVQPVFYFKKCFDMFKDIPVLAAQKMVLGALKNRKKIEKDFLDDIPDELKTVAYFSDTPVFAKEIHCFLERSYGG